MRLIILGLFLLTCIGYLGTTPSLAQSPPQGQGAGGLEDFPKLRAAAKAVAAKWNAEAQCFRADLWGTYTNSRFRPGLVRFIYFAKSNPSGYEVRADNQGVRGFDYRLEHSIQSPPQPLADQVISPDEAVRRLWDLAPTVRFDQVYLQLLRPGTEKPVTVEGDPSATGYPLFSYLQKFPVPFHDKEADAPKDRAVWRMPAVRDFNVLCDQAYGVFLNVDAATGEALSKRQPAVGVQIYKRHGLIPPTPIQPFLFSKEEIPLDSLAEQVGTFNPVAVGQKVESIDLGLRQMVRDARPDEEIRAALDKMLAWWVKIQQVRQEDAAHGPQSLEDAVRQDPKDLRKMLALFTRYVDEVEKEKKVALASDRVTRVERIRTKSQFWFERQYEVSDACLGTRNQTHVVLDTKSGEWIYKLQDPPNTGVFSKYYRPAVEQLQKAIAAAGGREDLDLQMQATRLRWLIGGNGPAVGDGQALNPIDALQLMAYAEFNRVVGSEKMLEAARLRLPKTWTVTTSDATVVFTRPPSAEELAAANRLDAVAKQQDAPRVAQVQDLALKLPATDARIYYMWSRIEAVFYDVQLADRIAVHGLMIDPADAYLHAARLIAWKKIPDVNAAEMLLVEKFTNPYTPADLIGGSSLAKQDLMSGYFLSLQRLRMDPENVGSHAIFCDTLSKLYDTKINGQEVMPDAREQHQRELGVAAAMMLRLLDRPDEWSKGLAGNQQPSRQNLVNNLVGLLLLRADDLVYLGRGDQARVCYQRILALDASNQKARQGLSQLRG